MPKLKSTKSAQSTTLSGPQDRRVSRAEGRAAGRALLRALAPTMNVIDEILFGSTPPQPPTPDEVAAQLRERIAALNLGDRGLEQMLIWNLIDLEPAAISRRLGCVKRCWAEVLRVRPDDPELASDLTAFAIDGNEAKVRDLVAQKRARRLLMSKASALGLTSEIALALERGDDTAAATIIRRAEECIERSVVVNRLRAHLEAMPPERRGTLREQIETLSTLVHDPRAFRIAFHPIESQLGRKP